MPKKGIIQCSKCGKEFEGLLPDTKASGNTYLSTEGEIDGDLIDRLLIHHNDSAILRLGGGNIGAHRNYIVFLDDGSTGEVEANTYFIRYVEHGKER